MTDERPAAEMVSGVHVHPAASREYDLAAVATATVDGPAGAVRVRRRYEALPRHNDVIDPDAVDSNDELVDRPDAVHVHTAFYAADGDEYFLDAHAVWTPEDPSALGDDEEFLSVCRNHYLTDLPRAYAWATAERRRRKRRR